MKNYDKEIGKKYGKLTIIKEDENKKYYVICKCDCGNAKLKSIELSAVKNGKIKTCGSCSIFEEIGKKYGKLTILSFDKKNKNSQKYFFCKCSCGNPELISIVLNNLKNGNTKSCGKCSIFEEIGKKYNKLTVISFDKTDEKFQKYFFCKCSCGNKKLKSIRLSELKSGGTKTCEKCEVNTKLHLLTQKVSKINTSGIKGVNFCKTRNKWQSRITLKGKIMYLGYFDDFEKAVVARKKAELEYFEPVLRKHGLELK